MTGQVGCLGRVGRHHQRVDGRHSSTLLGGAEVLQVGGRLVAVPLLPGGAAVGGAEGGGDGGRGLVAMQVAVLEGGDPGAGQDGVLLVCRRALARPWNWAAGYSSSLVTVSAGGGDTIAILIKIQFFKCCT